MKVLPPIVVAPVIIVIGLALSPTAIGMASTIQVGDDKGIQPAAFLGSTCYTGSCNHLPHVF